MAHHSSQASVAARHHRPARRDPANSAGNLIASFAAGNGTQISQEGTRGYPSP
jgi:hypothetical protein